MSLHLNLTFGPKWENVTNIRIFVTEILSSGIIDVEDAKKVATATSELVENLVKYSTISGADIRITRDKSIGKISLSISNITNQENLTAFETIYHEICQGEPKEAYKKMMLKSFQSDEKSQLGLARIRYECQGKITYNISNNIDIIEQHSEIEIPHNGDKLLNVTVEIPVAFQNK